MMVFDNFVRGRHNTFVSIANNGEEKFYSRWRGKYRSKLLQIKNIANITCNMKLNHNLFTRW